MEEADFLKTMIRDMNVAVCENNKNIMRLTARLQALEANISSVVASQKRDMADQWTMISELQKKVIGDN